MEFKKRPIFCPGTQPGGGAGYAVGKSASRGRTFKTLASIAPSPYPSWDLKKFYLFFLSQGVKANESCSKFHVKGSSTSVVPKEIVLVPC